MDENKDELIKTGPEYSVYNVPEENHINEMAVEGEKIVVISGGWEIDNIIYQKDIPADEMTAIVISLRRTPVYTQLSLDEVFEEESEDGALC